MAWENLREDIAAEFEPFVHRRHEIDEAFEWIVSMRRQAAREARRLEDGLTARRRKTQPQTRIALRLAAGLCAMCDAKRAPNSRRLCVKHLKSHSKREIQRKRRKGLEEVAAGRCYALCGRPIREHSHGAAPRAGRRPVLCEHCLDMVLRRLYKKRADRVAAGMCANGCNRPIARRPAHRGKPPQTCAICAARSREYTRQRYKTKTAEGLCPCGQPTRKVESQTRKRKPVWCETCAAKGRARHLARRKVPPGWLLVPAAPVRAHLLQLRSLGISLSAMARVAGVTLCTVRRMVDVRIPHLRARTAERLLELEAVLVEEPVPPEMIGYTGRRARR
jgi:hypothetical protein